MKITICSSMRFANEIRAVKYELEKSGYTVFVPVDMEDHINNPGLKNEVTPDFLIKNNLIGDHFYKVSNSDAILVLNYPKNGIDNYIGGSVLMEIGLAYYLNKKIFLLNGLPDQNELSYTEEITAMQPVLLNGSLVALLDSISN
jgi:hypothetical protein